MLRTGLSTGWRFLPAALVVALGVDSAPAMAGSPVELARAQPALSAGLFASVYRDIADNALDRTKPVELAAAGLAHLPGAPTLRVDGKAIVLADTAGPVLRLGAPADASGWGRATTQMIEALRRREPAIAALSADATYHRFFDGVVSRLDRFTHYADRAQAAAERGERDGFGGVGLTLDEDARVAAVLADGPAARAGVSKGDRLVAIDGTPPDTHDPADPARRLRGPVGSAVTVSLERGRRRWRRTLTRALVMAPSVRLAMDDGVAVLDVDGFNRRTADDIAAELRRIDREGAGRLRGIVLDLRNNPGGLLDQARAVAGLFLDHAVIAATEGRNPAAAQRLLATGGDQAHGLPIVVLVNGGSASSAEIVAAALQDDRRAVLVGSSSFGKGTVQVVLPLENDGELVLTWARIYAPGGYSLDHHGVVPAFCTSEAAPSLTDPGHSSAEQVLKTGEDRPAGAAGRRALDDKGWQRLRAACPTTLAAPDLDLAVARRLIDEPERYAKALAPATVAHASPASVRD